MKGDTGITIPFVGKETVIWPLQMGSYRCRIHVGFCFLLLNKTATGPANVGDGDTVTTGTFCDRQWKIHEKCRSLPYIIVYNYRNSRQTCGFPGQLKLSHPEGSEGISTEKCHDHWIRVFSAKMLADPHKVQGTNPSDLASTSHWQLVYGIPLVGVQLQLEWSWTCWENLRRKWWIFRCQVWLPKGTWDIEPFWFKQIRI